MLKKIVEMVILINVHDRDVWKHANETPLNNSFTLVINKINLGL
jgi:hypothetical protein